MQEMKQVCFSWRVTYCQMSLTTQNVVTITCAYVFPSTKIGSSAHKWFCLGYLHRHAMSDETDTKEIKCSEDL